MTEFDDFKKEIATLTKVNTEFVYAGDMQDGRLLAVRKLVVHGATEQNVEEFIIDLYRSLTRDAKKVYIRTPPHVFHVFNDNMYKGTMRIIIDEGEQ